MKPNETPSGQPVGGQWAAQQKRGMAKQEQAEDQNSQASHPQLSDEEQKQLEKDPASEEEGGAGSPQSSRLESEKQGGIGGP